MKKGIISILMATIFSTAIFTGCGASDNSTQTSSGEKSFKGKTLNLLTWEGYSDPEIIKNFEEKYGCKINGTYFTTSDDLIAKIKAGGGNSYDVISPSGDLAGFLVQSDMVEPIDTSKITNFNDINKNLLTTDVEKNGKTYGVPYLWGPDYLIYDADVIKEEPKSWSVFEDPKYSGRIGLFDDISNIYMIGQMDGIDKTDASALYNMTDEQLSDAKKKLTKLNSSVRKYWVSAGELNDLFANKEVDIAVGWPMTVQKLNAQGRNLKWTIPEEGCTGWQDRLMIVKGSKNKDLAELYIDYALSPETQAISAKVTNYCVANPKAADYMDDELKKTIGINDMDTFFEKINFWQYVKNRDKYNEIWTEVKTSK